MTEWSMEKDGDRRAQPHELDTSGEMHHDRRKEVNDMIHKHLVGFVKVNELPCGPQKTCKDVDNLKESMDGQFKTQQWYQRIIIGVLVVMIGTVLTAMVKVSDTQGDIALTNKTLISMDAFFKAQHLMINDKVSGIDELLNRNTREFTERITENKVRIDTLNKER